MAAYPTLERMTGGRPGKLRGKKRGGGPMRHQRPNATRGDGARKTRTGGGLLDRLGGSIMGRVSPNIMDILANRLGGDRGTPVTAGGLRTPNGGGAPQLFPRDVGGATRAATIDSRIGGRFGAPVMSNPMPPVAGVPTMSNPMPGPDAGGDVMFGDPGRVTGGGTGMRPGGPNAWMQGGTFVESDMPPPLGAQVTSRARAPQLFGGGGNMLTGMQRGGRPVPQRSNPFPPPGPSTVMPPPMMSRGY